MRMKVEPANCNENSEMDRPLNRLELGSIQALVAYAAHTQRASEETVKEILIERFGVTDIENLNAASYEDAIRFLVDIQVNMVLH